MLNRSKIVSQLKILCISFLLALYLQNFTVAQEREKYVKKNPSVIKKWIVEAVKGNTKAVSGKLLLDRFRGPIYFLTDKIYWSPNAEASNLPSIAVPEGFVTDFASVPPMFFSVLRPDGEYAYAAVIHDYLYWTREVT